MSRVSRLPWIPILLYHHVTPDLPQFDPDHNFIRVETFERQLKWLRKRGWNTISLSALDRILAQGEASAIPSRSVIITFDDGYEDNYLYAWPLLIKYGLSATIFLVSDAIGGDNSFDRALPGYQPSRMLSEKQLRKMDGQSIEFGAHTRSHPYRLTALSDDALHDELCGSRDALQQLLNAPIDTFAYPYHYVDARVESIVEGAGYRLACAGPGRRFSRYRLNRIWPITMGGAGVEVHMRTRSLKLHIRGFENEQFAITSSG